MKQIPAKADVAGQETFLDSTTKCNGLLKEYLKGRTEIKALSGTIIELVGNDFQVCL